MSMAQEVLLRDLLLYYHYVDFLDYLVSSTQDFLHEAQLTFYVPDLLET